MINNACSLVDTLITCNICKGLMWVCECHPNSLWDDSEENGCECSAGMPCVCNPLGGLPSEAKIIIQRKEHINC